MPNASVSASTSAATSVPESPASVVEDDRATSVTDPAVIAARVGWSSAPETLTENVCPAAAAIPSDTVTVKLSAPVSPSSSASIAAAFLVNV